MGVAPGGSWGGRGAAAPFGTCSALPVSSPAPQWVLATPPPRLAFIPGKGGKAGGLWSPRWVGAVMGGQ